MDRRGLHVLYFALRPPSASACAAVGLAERTCAALGLTGCIGRVDRLHVSLNFVGAFRRTPAQVIDQARRAADAVAARPFVLAFNRLETWGRGAGPRPVVLSGDEGVIGVEALHDRLHDRLAAPGIVRGPPRPIWPHMTLLRDHREIETEIVAPIAWRVTEFLLFDALHGEGDREIRGVWPLTG